MVKEVEKAGFPIVQMCNLVPVAKTEQWKLRYHRTKVALEALATDIKEQTVFKV